MSNDEEVSGFLEKLIYSYHLDKADPSFAKSLTIYLFCYMIETDIAVLEELAEMNEEFQQEVSSLLDSLDSFMQEKRADYVAEIKYSKKHVEKFCIGIYDGIMISDSLMTTVKSLLKSLSVKERMDLMDSRRLTLRLKLEGLKSMKQFRSKRMSEQIDSMIQDQGL